MAHKSSSESTKQPPPPPFFTTPQTMAIENFVEKQNNANNSHFSFFQKDFSPLKKIIICVTLL